MKEYLNEMLIESAKKKGHLCASDMTFNATTINNYMALFANKGGISLTEKSIAKTNARWTAEHSSIGTMALIIVVACTHFYVVASDDIEWRQFLNSLPDDSKVLYKMVSKFHGGKPVRVRKPHLITNQDDETEFICKGKQVDNSSHVGLVATTALLPVTILNGVNFSTHRFYYSFPSKTSARSTSTVKEGYYEHLTAYVGVGFSAEYPPGCFMKSGGL